MSPRESDPGLSQDRPRMAFTFRGLAVTIATRGKSMKQMRKLRRGLLGVALLMVALHGAAAETYTVNMSADTVVANACANHQTQCSLRGAILAANAHSGDTIVFNIQELCPMSGCAIGVLSSLPDITAPMS